MSLNNYTIKDREQAKFAELAGGDIAIKTTMLNSLVPDCYDYMELTYVTVGNGTGKIHTVVYKRHGTTIATLTLTYDSSDRISTITRS